ncbi:MAG: hypothetical protein ACXWTS_02895, partial [Methylococcaceae bacterium]
MKENKVLTLKLIGFSGHKTEKFSAIFNLAEHRLKQNWQIVDTDSADFFILTEKLKSDQSSYLNSLPPERCLFCSSTENATDNNNVLVDINRIPRLSSLIQALNRIAETISEQTSPVLTAK